MHCWTETAKRKAKAVDTRMQRRLQQIASLLPEERHQILQTVDALMERGQLKRNPTASSRLEGNKSAAMNRPIDQEILEKLNRLARERLTEAGGLCRRLAQPR